MSRPESREQGVEVSDRSLGAISLLTLATFLALLVNQLRVEAEENEVA